MAGEFPEGPGAADDFKAGIRLVMEMGLPGVEADQPTFYFDPGADYEPDDHAGAPMDWEVVPVDPGTPRDPVRVLCGISAAGGPTGVTRVGPFNADRYVLSFFEEEWAQIAGFEYVTLGQKRFYPSKTLPPEGLFSVTTYKVEVEARDT